MRKRLLRSLWLQKGNILIALGGVLGCWFLGTLLMSIIFWADETAEAWFCMGAISGLLAMAGFMLLLFWTYPREFMLALSMGQTRREFMLTYALQQTLWLLAAYVAVLLLQELEGLYYGLMFPDKAKAFALDFMTDGGFVALLISGLVLLNMFLGTMYSRFGKKFLGILYFVWIGACIFLPRLLVHWEEYTGPLQQELRAVARWLSALPPAAWAAVAVAGAGAMAAAVLRLGMKQAVR